jgi:hypothetical protein
LQGDARAEPHSQEVRRCVQCAAQVVNLWSTIAAGGQSESRPGEGRQEEGGFLKITTDGGSEEEVPLHQASSFFFFKREDSIEEEEVEYRCEDIEERQAGGE